MRALLIVLDSVGCGDAPDAAAYGDEGANTLGHVFAAQPHLSLPDLFSLGLWKAVSADMLDARSLNTGGLWGRMRERSAGQSSIGALASVYYMVKVMLALFIGLFRKNVTPLEEVRT